MTLRVDEHYVSVQGEGPRVGTTTQFIRFGGCNLRCAGWPCDTQHAIDPKFRKEWVQAEAIDIVYKADGLRDETGANNICLTGGEPFLQPRKDLSQLVARLNGNGFQVECFSNGTLIYPEWVRGHLNFIMDWKLLGSGEAGVNVSNRWDNLHRLNGAAGNAVKFVLKDEHDLHEAELVWDKIQNQQLLNIIPYYGRVWDSEWTDADMIAAVLKRRLPWHLNIQVHNYIWDRSLRGI